MRGGYPELRLCPLWAVAFPQVMQTASTIVRRVYRIRTECDRQWIVVAPHGWVVY